MVNWFIIISMLGYALMLFIKFFKGMCTVGWRGNGEICGNELLFLAILVSAIATYYLYLVVSSKKKAKEIDKK